LQLKGAGDDRNFWTKRVLLTCAPLAMTMVVAEASAMTFDFTGDRADNRRL
jgi:hypothetical protein